jgi:hypothetical protein
MTPPRELWRLGPKELLPIKGQVSEKTSSRQFVTIGTRTPAP